MARVPATKHTLILGGGEVASALATTLASGGRRVTMALRDEQSLREMVSTRRFVSRRAAQPIHPNIALAHLGNASEMEAAVAKAQALAVCVPLSAVGDVVAPIAKIAAAAAPRAAHVEAEKASLGLGPEPTDDDGGAAMPVAVFARGLAVGGMGAAGLIARAHAATFPNVVACATATPATTPWIGAASQRCALYDAAPQAPVASAEGKQAAAAFDTMSPGVTPTRHIQSQRGSAAHSSGTVPPLPHWMCGASGGATLQGINAAHGVLSPLTSEWPGLSHLGDVPSGAVEVVPCGGSTADILRAMKSGTSTPAPTEAKDMVSIMPHDTSVAVYDAAAAVHLIDAVAQVTSLAAGLATAAHGTSAVVSMAVAHHAVVAVTALLGALLQRPQFVLPPLAVAHITAAATDTASREFIAGRRAFEMGDAEQGLRTALAGWRYDVMHETVAQLAALDTTMLRSDGASFHCALRAVLEFDRPVAEVARHLGTRDGFQFLVAPQAEHPVHGLAKVLDTALEQGTFSDAATQASISEWMEKVQPGSSTREE